MKGYLFWPLKSQDPKRMPYAEGLVDSWTRKCSSPQTQTSSLTDPLPLQEHSPGLMPWTQPRSIPGLRLVNNLQWKRGHRSLSAYGNPTLPLFLSLITYPKQKGKQNETHTETIPSIPSTGRKWLPSLPLHVTDTFSSATVEPNIHQLHCFWPWIQPRAEEPRNHIIQFGWWVTLRLSIKMLQISPLTP